MILFHISATFCNTYISISGEHLSCGVGYNYVFNESIKSNARIVSLVNKKYRFSEQSILKADLKSRFCTMCMKCIIDNAGLFESQGIHNLRDYATMWQKNDVSCHMYVTDVENRFVLSRFFIVACLYNFHCTIMFTWFVFFLLFLYIHVYFHFFSLT